MQTIQLLIIATAAAVTLASPKKYSAEEGGFAPSHRYYESNLEPDNNKFHRNGTQNLQPAEPKAAKEADRHRFGIPISNYGSTGSGVQYGSNNVGYMMTPMKVDIGGIALGALIGLGAILIIPKLTHLFGSGGGAGYRSIESDMSSFTNVLARIDNSLEAHNIDSSSCMQRIICTYVNDAQKNMHNGDVNTFDQLIVSISNNPLFSFLLDGTAVKQAIEMGKTSDVEKCTSLYSKCPITKENVLKVVSSLLPA